jgi:2'-5' RNA ligase
MRVFVGIGFTKEAQNGVMKVLKMLEKKHWLVKWEPIEKLHITLVYLGDIDEEQLSNVIEAVKIASKQVTEFTISFKGLGSFPTLLLPLVVWLGLKGDLKSLALLKKEIQKALRSANFPFDEKPFRPHVTLGRVEKSARRKIRLEMGKEIGKLREMDIPQKLRVDGLCVFESVVGKAGPEYKILDEIKLG